jgi:hypothetical protein
VAATGARAGVGAVGSVWPTSRATAAATTAAAAARTTVNGRPSSGAPRSSASGPSSGVATRNATAAVAGAPPRTRDSYSGNTVQAHTGSGTPNATPRTASPTRPPAPQPRGVRLGERGGDEAGEHVPGEQGGGAVEREVDQRAHGLAQVRGVTPHRHRHHPTPARHRAHRRPRADRRRAVTVVVAVVVAGGVAVARRQRHRRGHRPHEPVRRGGHEVQRAGRDPSGAVVVCVVVGGVEHHVQQRPRHQPLEGTFGPRRQRERLPEHVAADRGRRDHRERAPRCPVPGRRRPAVRQRPQPQPHGHLVRRHRQRQRPAPPGQGQRGAVQHRVHQQGAGPEQRPHRGAAAGGAVQERRPQEPDEPGGDRHQPGLGDRVGREVQQAQAAHQGQGQPVEEPSPRAPGWPGPREQRPHRQRQHRDRQHPRAAHPRPPPSPYRTSFPDATRLPPGRPPAAIGCTGFRWGPRCRDRGVDARSLGPSRGASPEVACWRCSWRPAPATHSRRPRPRSAAPTRTPPPVTPARSRVAPATRRRPRSTPTARTSRRRWPRSCHARCSPRCSSRELVPRAARRGGARQRRRRVRQPRRDRGRQRAPARAGSVPRAAKCDDPDDDGWELCGWDPAYTFRKVMVDFCGRSPTWSRARGVRPGAAAPRRRARHPRAVPSTPSTGAASAGRCGTSRTARSRPCAR